jgi:hypothetical protein
MKRFLNCCCIIGILFFIFCSYIYAKTEQEMMQEYNKWMEILKPDLVGIESKPVRIKEYKDSWSKKCTFIL